MYLVMKSILDIIVHYVTRSKALPYSTEDEYALGFELHTILYAREGLFGVIPGMFGIRLANR